MSNQKKMNPVQVERVKSDHIPNVGEMVNINDVHAGKINPHELTAEDLDVSWPSFRDRRFQ